MLNNYSLVSEEHLTIGLYTQQEALHIYLVLFRNFSQSVHILSSQEPTRHYRVSMKIRNTNYHTCRQQLRKTNLNIITFTTYKVETLRYKFKGLKNILYNKKHLFFLEKKTQFIIFMLVNIRSKINITYQPEV